MSTLAGRAVGNMLDPLHLVYKPDAPSDPNRDAALAASRNAETTAEGDAQQRLAQIYGSALPALQQGTGLAADQARLRQQQLVSAADASAAWRPGTFDAQGTAAPDIVSPAGMTQGQDVATAGRVAQLAQQRADMQRIFAGQQGGGPSLAAAQTASAMDVARRNAGMIAAASHGGNAALAARAGILNNTAPGVAVQGGMARGQELATLRGAAGTGVTNLFGNQLGLDANAQAQQQMRAQAELANRQALARQAGLASDAFGSSVRDYKVGGALQKNADLTKLNAYDTSMQDQENAFSSYQDYLQSLYGTGLHTATTAGARAAGNLDTILGAQRQQDAANAGLASTLVGGVMGAVGKAGSTQNANDNGGGG